MGPQVGRSGGLSSAGQVDVHPFGGGRPGANTGDIDPSTQDSADTENKVPDLKGSGEHMTDLNLILPHIIQPEDPGSDEDMPDSSVSQSYTSGSQGRVRCKYGE